MDDEPIQQPPKYVPTAEELAADSWQHCYGQPVVIPPPTEETTDGHSV